MAHSNAGRERTALFCELVSGFHSFSLKLLCFVSFYFSREHIKILLLQMQLCTHLFENPSNILRFIILPHYFVLILTYMSISPNIRDFISPNTIKTEAGLTHMMDQYDKNFKVRQLLGSTADMGGKMGTKKVNSNPSLLATLSITASPGAATPKMVAAQNALSSQ